jgi:hypothetical protein
MKSGKEVVKVTKKLSTGRKMRITVFNREDGDVQATVAYMREEGKPTKAELDETHRYVEAVMAGKGFNGVGNWEKIQ